MPFTSHAPVGDTLARFTNDRQDSVIQEILILSNPDEDLTLRVIADSPASRQRIVEALGQTRYYQFYGETGVELKSSDKRLFINFLTHLIRFNVVELGPILLTLRDRLGISVNDLRYRQIPEWVARGSMKMPGVSSRIYQFTSPQAELKNIEIKPIEAGQYLIYLTFNTHETLLKAVNACGFNQSNLGSNVGNHLALSPTSDKDKIRVLFDTLLTARFIPREFSSFINNELNKAWQLSVPVDMVTKANLFLLRSAQRLHRFTDNLRPPVLLPDIKHNNQAILDEYKIKSEIPERFICGISGVIMDKPVHVPGLAGHANQADAQRWLRVSGGVDLRGPHVHPATRTPIIVEDLVHDQDLQKELDDFMEGEKNKQQPGPESSHKRLKIDK